MVWQFANQSSDLYVLFILITSTHLTKTPHPPFLISNSFMIYNDNIEPHRCQVGADWFAFLVLTKQQFFDILLTYIKDCEKEEYISEYFPENEGGQLRLAGL